MDDTFSKAFQVVNDSKLTAEQSKPYRNQIKMMLLHLKRKQQALALDQLFATLEEYVTNISDPSVCKEARTKLIELNDLLSYKAIPFSQ